MDKLLSLKWWKIERNRAAALAILTVVTALLTGAWFAYQNFFAERETQPAPFGVEQLSLALKERETAIRADLERAHSAEKQLILAQLDEVRRQLADPEQALVAARQQIAELESLLGDTGSVDEQAARTALERGDLATAAEIFERIAASKALHVKKAADANFALGQIAEIEVRWKDAAQHYGDAARLSPSFENLRKAREFAWRAGQFDKALRAGAELVTTAVSEFGRDSSQHATALNEHALTLVATSRYAEAEPLYRQALAIDEKTLGADHPDFATRLNNLAGLFEATGRYAEAEPLYKQALAIDAKTLGEEHPDYATDLNNLAGLYRATGRYAEAEPLYRQALAIGEKTLGTDHPAYAGRLNNLAALLRATGRYAEAEPLYRQALAIDEKTLGADHPDYAAHLNNLAELLQATGRFAEAEPLYRQALAIFEKALRKDHPNTVTVRGNLDELLRSSSSSTEPQSQP